MDRSVGLIEYVRVHLPLPYMYHHLCNIAACILRDKQVTTLKSFGFQVQVSGDLKYRGSDQMVQQVHAIENVKSPSFTHPEFCMF